MKLTQRQLKKMVKEELSRVVLKEKRDRTMKLTKRQLIQIIKEELEDTMEEGWWPFGEKESPIQKRSRIKREKKARKKQYDQTMADIDKKLGREPDGERTADKEAREAGSARNQARYDAEQKKKQKATDQKKRDAEYDKQQRIAKRKEDEKNKIEHWNYKSGRGSMAVQVNNPESVASFHRANGTEIPEWVLKALGPNARY